MPLNHIRHMLLLIWIYSFMISITMTLSSDVNSTKSKYDEFSTTTESATSGASDGDKSYIRCPEYCRCYKDSYEPSSHITALCEKLTNETYFDSNIDSITLAYEYHKNDTMTLGPREFRRCGLKNLKSIRLTNPLYSEIDQAAFDGLPYLNSIMFVFSTYFRLNPDLFQNNSQLNSISIHQGENFMDDCNATKKYLFDSSSVTNLIFSVPHYKCWSPSPFTKMPNLTSLTLSSENITMVAGILAPLHKLRTLELSFIKNLTIVKNTFDGITIRKLILDHSVMTPLHNIHVATLQILTMTNIQIKNIRKDDFIGMPALEELKMTRCTIETIHEDAFSHLTQLKFLDISYNNIASFTENHLRNNFQLRTLLMSDNRNLKHLPVFKLNSTDNNSYIIEEFYCNGCGLESIAEETFNGLPALKLLHLNKNQLESLPRGLFKPLSSLESLDLSFNLITNIPDNMFEGATKLSFIDLHNNQFTTLPMTPFLQMPELNWLGFSHHQISIWSVIDPPGYTLSFFAYSIGREARITVKELGDVPDLFKLQEIFEWFGCNNTSNEKIEWFLTHNLTATFNDPPFSNCNEQFSNKSCWEIVRNSICSPK